MRKPAWLGNNKGISLLCWCLLLPLVWGQEGAFTTNDTDGDSSLLTSTYSWMAKCQQSLGGMKDEDSFINCLDLMHAMPMGDEMNKQRRAAAEAAPVEGLIDDGEGTNSGCTPSSGRDDADPHSFASFKYTKDIIDLAMAFFCVLAAAIASGLTIGLMSINQLELEIKQRCGTDEEIYFAKRILPVLKRKHLLLVTLLLFNSLAAEALPLFLDNLVPSYIAVIISVTMVLFFGEIFPSAFFSGPSALKLASRLSGVVWFLMVLFFPIAYPVSRFLDWFLGEEDHGRGKRYNRTELTALIEIHQAAHPLQKVRPNNKDKADLEREDTGTLTPLDISRRAWRALVRSGSIDSVEDSVKSGSTVTENRGSRTMNRQTSLIVQPDFRSQWPSVDCEVGSPVKSSGSDISSPSKTNAGLSSQEVTLVTGLLGFSCKTVKDCYTPWSEVCSCSLDDVLDKEMLAKIRKEGHSRIPVVKQRVPGQDKADPRHVVGFILSKHLITVNSEDKRTIGSIGRLCPIIVSPDCPLIEVITSFQQGRAHLAFVSQDPDIALQCLMEDIEMDSYTSPIGIITFEDVMEVVLQGEIKDEKDHEGDDHPMGPWILSQEHSKKLRTLSTLSNLSSMRRLSTKSASLFRDLSVRDFSGEGDDQDHPNIDDADQTVRIDIAKETSSTERLSRSISFSRSRSWMAHSEDSVVPVRSEKVLEAHEEETKDSGSEAGSGKLLIKSHSSGDGNRSRALSSGDAELVRGRSFELKKSRSGEKHRSMGSGVGQGEHHLVAIPPDLEQLKYG